MFQPSRPDIALLPNREVDWFAGRLFRSQGTAVAADVEPSLSPWLPRARLPQGPWRPLRPRDIEAMLNASAPRASTVAVARLPDDLTRRAQTLGAAAWRPELGSLAPLRDDPQGRALTRDVAEFLRTWTAYGARPQDVFLGGSRGGHATTCWSAGESAWVGLHVDDWRNKPPGERAFSPNRLMMNAGTQPRHLVFMDRTVAAMALELNLLRSRLGQPPISLRSGSPHDIGLTFMETFPEYPLLRLRIDPGEAYIAPTDNLVHDGSTFDMRGDRPADIILCALGYLEPARLAPREGAANELSEGCPARRTRETTFGRFSRELAPSGVRTFTGSGVQTPPVERSADPPAPRLARVP